MERYVCIHGHFYQPPRENPWLESIEVQDSAYPYHDWNERITAECYDPNTAARILNPKGWIKQIINNYSKISFNFGPTLLDWLASREPEVYKAIIEADRESQKIFSGHGSAFAQTYNHMIMPLANSRDKKTQVVWGIRDFEKRFGRRPEGMWLPETGVDMETLEILAVNDIKFTVLAPYQAKRVRRIGSSGWLEVGHAGIDPSMAYQIRLPASGRTLAVFFYDGPISQAVAFENLLANGERFAHRLESGFSGLRDWPQLVNIATDGETYGHHHRHGEMALAYALHYITFNKLARVINYGEYLAKHPPLNEVEIKENTAWSCVHGVERWQSDCGCNSGLHPGWNQSWRTPLRHALNWLRNNVAPCYEELARQFIKDPWAARDEYIEVILDRSPDSLCQFLAKHAKRELEPNEQVTVWKLLEVQRHAMLMFTSCGWFFDEISGIETVQVLQYAGRVIQLAEELFPIHLEPHFLELLAHAKSNVHEHGEGAKIYQKFVKPAMVDLVKVGAHYAISSLFEKYGAHTRIFCYDVDRLNCREQENGDSKLEVGQIRITSRVTRETTIISYGVAYFGYQNMNSGVRVYIGEEAYREMENAVAEAFNRNDVGEVARLLEHFFGKRVIHSLKQIFRDQRRKILQTIIESTKNSLEEDYQKIYEQHVSLMHFLKDLDRPLPQALQCAADFYLKTTLRRHFAQDDLDFANIQSLLDDARHFEVKLDDTGIVFTLEKTLGRLAEKLRSNPEDLSLLENLNGITGLARSLPFEVDLWKVQNIYYRLLQSMYTKVQAGVREGYEDRQIWISRFDDLGNKLQVQKGV